MSVADLHDLELVWPSLGPTDVIVTGTFDQWSASIHLVKGDTGFSGTVKVPWGEKVAYKFIVDGRWRCRDDRPQEDDEHGNINNVLLTPDKPLSPLHERPVRLSIPLEPDGYGDAENMVTAVEFLPLAEPAIIKGQLPLPVPQIFIEGLGRASSMSESKLDTAAATEGHVSPAKLAPFKEAPSSHDVAMLSTDSRTTTSSQPSSNDKVPVFLPAVNGTREAHESHSMSGHAVADGELPSPVPETGKEAESAVVSQPSSQAIQDGPAPSDHVDEPPAVAPITVSELATKRSQVDSVETAARASTLASSTPTHKKRRSLFARIKHIFERDKDKKERDKH